MAGIKETSEGVVALAALYKEYKALDADGKIDLSDLIAFIDKLNSDPAFMKQIQDGVVGAGQIGAELADLDLFEILSLLKLLSLFK